MGHRLKDGFRGRRTDEKQRCVQVYGRLSGRCTVSPFSCTNILASVKVASLISALPSVSETKKKKKIVPTIRFFNNIMEYSGIFPRRGLRKTLFQDIF